MTWPVPESESLRELDQAWLANSCRRWSATRLKDHNYLCSPKHNECVYLESFFILMDPLP